MPNQTTGRYKNAVLRKGSKEYEPFLPESVAILNFVPTGNLPGFYSGRALAGI
jgi:hypothetical protein